MEPIFTPLKGSVQEQEELVQKLTEVMELSIHMGKRQCRDQMDAAISDLFGETTGG